MVQGEVTWVVAGGVMVAWHGLWEGWCSGSVGPCMWLSRGMVEEEEGNWKHGLWSRTTGLQRDG